MSGKLARWAELTDLLRRFLLADTPRVSPALREQQLRARVRGGQLRRRW